MSLGRFFACTCPALFALAAAAGCVTSDQGAGPTPQAAPGAGEAKNVILMVSDGIGFNGWLAADYYQGLAGRQSYQITRPGGAQPLVFGMTHDALNPVDAAGALVAEGGSAADAVRQGYDPATRWQRFEATFLNDFAPVAQAYTSYTDSAASGTALMTGQKTVNGRINMDWSGQVAFPAIGQIALDQGRAVGVVASVMASHATPASVISHNRSRNNYEEIFAEMLASDLAVIMGAGHPFYNANGAPLGPGDTPDFQYVGGEETMDALTRPGGIDGVTFIDAKAQFEALALSEAPPRRVVGIARSSSTLQAARQGLASADTPSGMALNPAVPDLATMGLGALNVLSQNREGFFLMIEGGAVDWMGHANSMPRFIEEQIDFNAAVDAVIAWVEDNSSWEETLLIVTSDHECGGIWGLGTWTNSEGGPVATDREVESLLAARFDPAEDAFNDFLAVQDRGAGALPGYQFASGNHTNELVPLWALGRGAAAFAGSARRDAKAAELWGAPYGWSGLFVDNTDVFSVMEAALTGSEAGGERVTP
ncbi:MAG: alkaline phosphatase [Pseudomonadota bacterium]